MFVKKWNHHKDCRAVLEEVIGDESDAMKLKRCQRYDKLRTCEYQLDHPSDRTAFENQVDKVLTSLKKRLPLPAGDIDIQEALQILEMKLAILNRPHRLRKAGWEKGWK